MDVGFEMENISERVGRLPGCGEVAANVHIVIARDEAAEEEAVDALGLAVGGVARVEIDRAGFDHERDVLRIELRGVGARCEREQGDGARY